MIVDGVDITLLVQRLGPDRLAPVGQDVERQDIGRAFLGLLPKHADRSLHGVGGQRLTGPDHDQKLVDQALDQGDLTEGTGDGDLVAPGMDVGFGNERSMERSTSSPAPSKDTMLTVGGTTMRCTACGFPPLPGFVPEPALAPLAWLPRWEVGEWCRWTRS